MLILGIVFGTVVLVVAYYVFALLYHWVRYGHLFPVVWLMLPVYAIGTAALLLVSLTALSALL